jgi:hypothetical protein
MLAVGAGAAAAAVAVLELPSAKLLPGVHDTLTDVAAVALLLLLPCALKFRALTHTAAPGTCHRFLSAASTAAAAAAAGATCTAATPVTLPLTVSPTWTSKLGFQACHMLRTHPCHCCCCCCLSYIKK